MVATRLITESLSRPWRADGRRGIVANRLAVPFLGRQNTGSDGGGTATMLQEQSRHFACADCADLSVIFANTTNGTADTFGYQPFTAKASVFIGGSYAPAFALPPLPVFWPNGSRVSAPVAPGSWLESLGIHLAAKKGDPLVLRRLLTFAAAPACWPGSEVNAAFSDETNIAGTALADNVDSADPAGTVYSRLSQSYMYGQPLILGRTATPVARVASLGDSIADGGSGDAGSEVLLGWLRRALGSDHPNMTIGNSGYQLGTMMGSPALRRTRLQLLAVCGITHLVCSLGTNDLGAGRTTAQLTAWLATLKGELDALGIKLVPTTVTPRTNAANAARYGADGTGVWAERLAYNDALRAANGVGYGLIDLAALTQSSSNGNLWDTTAGRGTADGIHPLGATHAYMAAQVAPSLPSLLAI